MGLRRRNPGHDRLMATVETPVAPVAESPLAAASDPDHEPPKPRVTIDPEPALEPEPARPAHTLPPPRVALSPEERRRRIAEAAYFRAQAASFRTDPVADWLAAEREIDKE